MKKLLATVSAAAFVVACQPTISSTESKHPQANQRAEARLKAMGLCQRLAEIKRLPPKQGAPVDDEVYNGLLALGDAAIPCLIEKITDTTEMKDPRRAPTRLDTVKVGDVAFFVLSDITNIFEQMLPHEVQSKLKDEGVYAYFDYVEKDDNRQAIRDKWRAWYSRNPRDKDPNRYVMKVHNLWR